MECIDRRSRRNELPQEVKKSPKTDHDPGAPNRVWSTHRADSPFEIFSVYILIFQTRNVVACGQF